MELPSIASKNLKDITLKHVARIPTSENSVFYALKHASTISNVREAFYRSQYDKRLLGRCFISLDQWSIIRDDGPIAIGEDPRVFEHDGVEMILDNTWGDSRLLLPNDRFKILQLPTNGKNLTLISHGSTTYCIEWFKPLRVHSCDDLEGGSWETKLARTQGQNLEYRGGTPGYATRDKSVYFGMGHRTIESAGLTTHCPFFWLLNVKNWNLTVADYGDEGIFSNNIVDPTCIVQHNDRYYLLTAESQRPWFGATQDFATNVYEISFMH